MAGPFTPLFDDAFVFDDGLARATRMRLPLDDGVGDEDGGDDGGAESGGNTAEEP